MFQITVTLIYFLHIFQNFNQSINREQIQVINNPTENNQQFIYSDRKMSEACSQFKKQINNQDMLQTNNATNKQYQFQPPSSNNNIYDQIESKYTSAFFKDHNQQQYAIYRAFNTNNFTYLRKLPNNMKHGVLLNQRKQKVTINSLDEASSRAKGFQSKLIQRQQKINHKRKQQIGTLGYFTPFEYQESNYEMPRIIDSLHRISSQQKRKQISSMQFRPSGIEAKMKYQDPFKFIDPSKEQNMNINNDYLYPFHLPEDTFDIYHESEMRRKVISQSLRLDGEFLPAQKEHTLTKVNKNKLSQMITQVEMFLKKYLQDVGFFIGVTGKDHIEVLFEEKHKDNTKISMIMSKICEHQMISKYLLRRNLQKWKMHDSKKGYIVYSLLPNWVKSPVEKLNS